MTMTDTQTQASSAEPRRLRWSIPAADISSNQWLDMQENISRSMQVLIRESIQRDGFIDVVNRPVEQLPRRGRPPMAESVGAAPDGPAGPQDADGVQTLGAQATKKYTTDDLQDGRGSFDPLEPDGIDEQVPDAPAPSAAEQSKGMSKLQQKKLERESQQAASPAPAAAMQTEAQNPPSQVDMNAIFGHNQ